MRLRKCQIILRNDKKTRGGDYCLTFSVREIVPPLQYHGRSG